MVDEKQAIKELCDLISKLIYSFHRFYEETNLAESLGPLGFNKLKAFDKDLLDITRRLSKLKSGL